MTSQLVHLAATARHLPHPTPVVDCRRSRRARPWTRASASLRLRVGVGRRSQPQFDA